MKRRIVLLLVATMLLGVTGVVGASRDSASTNLTMRVEILSPIELSLLNGLDFGKVFKGDMEVIVDPSAPAVGTTPAAFQVSGEGNTGFKVKLPSTATVRNGNASLNVKNFISNLTNEGGVLDSSGLASFKVGATLAQVPATAASGVYNGAATVTVVYSY